MNILSENKYLYAQATKKVGPFIPRLKDGGFLGRSL